QLRALAARPGQHSPAYRPSPHPLARPPAQARAAQIGPEHVNGHLARPFWTHSARESPPPERAVRTAIAFRSAVQPCPVLQSLTYVSPRQLPMAASGHAVRDSAWRPHGFNLRLTILSWDRYCAKSSEEVERAA